MYYKINGVKMPSCEFEGMESNHLYGPNTGRDETGRMHLDLIRADVRKWAFLHKGITRQQLDDIKKACGALAISAEVPTSLGYETVGCYANVTDIKMSIANDYLIPTGSIWQCKVTLIEL
ncbi:MAG: hypothetical protein QM211_02830 [Bacillota bacterium]|nr:hypothetical protein [Bacillota bacterium]